MSAVGPKAQAVLDETFAPSPTPPPSTYADTDREYCGVWIVADDDEDAASHNCTLPPLHTSDHECAKCGKTWPISPDERHEALNDLQRRAEALFTGEKLTHSRRITERLLEEPSKALSPTEVIPSVQRAPGLDAIATAAQRLVKRMSREIGSSSETAWRISLPTLESRIATRLELVGLSPATALRTAAAVAADVRGEATIAEEFIRTRVTEAAEADVARNLLPRISKVMKETSHG